MKVFNKFRNAFTDDANDTAYMGAQTTAVTKATTLKKIPNRGRQNRRKKKDTMPVHTEIIPQNTNNQNTLTSP